jgi:hypothetical protein
MFSSNKCPSVHWALAANVICNSATMFNNHFLNINLIVNLVNSYNICYIHCYYKITFVLHILSSRISYMHVFVLHLCIVSFTFYSFELLCKNTELNWIKMQFIINIPKQLLPFWKTECQSDSRDVTILNLAL